MKLDARARLLMARKRIEGFEILVSSVIRGIDDRVAVRAMLKSIKSELDGNYYKEGNSENGD